MSLTQGTKYAELRFWNSHTPFSMSRIDILPRYATDTVRYLPSAGSIAANKLFLWKMAAVSSCTLVA